MTSPHEPTMRERDEPTDADELEARAMRLLEYAINGVKRGKFDDAERNARAAAVIIKKRKSVSLPGTLPSGGEGTLTTKGE